MKLHHLFALSASTLSFTLFAQTPAAPEQPRIDVTGTAEMQVVPDEIYIAIGLKERGSGNGKRTIEMQEAELKKAVVDLGIDPAALTLTDALADYRGRLFSADDVVTRKAYELKVGDAEMVRKVFKELDRLEIQDAQVSRTNHSKITEYRRQMRIQAIKAAKEKADYLLEAIGERTGAALTVEEGMNAPELERLQGLRMAYSNVMREEAFYDHEDLGIAFSRIKVTANVSVRFAIAKRTE